MYISYIFITLTHPCEKTEASNTSSHCSCRCFDVIGVSLKTSLHSRNLPILAPQQRCGSWHRQTPDTPCITGQPTRDDQLLRLTSLGVAVASRRSPSRTGSLPPFLGQASTCCIQVDRLTLDDLEAPRRDVTMWRGSGRVGDRRLESPVRWAWLRHG